MRDINTGRLCTIYKGDKEQELYVYVPQESGTENIPEELSQRMGEIREVMTISINPERKLARVKAVNVLASIDEIGYFVQLPPEITGQVLNDGD